MLKAIPCTARELASVLTLSERRVSELTRVGTFGKPYNLLTCVKAYIAFLKTDQGTSKAERLRFVKLKSDLLALTLEERTGELVRRSAVANKEFSTGRRVRDGCQNIPSRVSGLCAAETSQEKIHALLTREINHTLEGICDATATITSEKDTTEEGYFPATARP